jgi:signal transduction histidine kinase
MAFHPENLPHLLQRPVIQKRFESNFETLFYESKFPKLLIDETSHSVIAANQSALKMYGYTQAQITQLVYNDLAVMKHSTHFEEQLCQAIVNRKFSNVKAKHKDYAGKIIDVFISFTYLLRRKRNCILIVIEDRTNILALKRELREQKAAQTEKIMAAAFAVKEKEKNHIVYNLRENVNQVLASANMYLGIAKNNDQNRMELIEKSMSNISEAINVVKKMYDNYEAKKLERNILEDSIEENIVALELEYQIQIHLVTEGKEQGLPEMLRKQLSNFVIQYIHFLVKTQKMDNIWINFYFAGTVEVTIRTDYTGNVDIPKGPEEKFRSMLKQIGSICSQHKIISAENNLSLKFQFRL